MKVRRINWVGVRNFLIIAGIAGIVLVWQEGFGDDDVTGNLSDRLVDALVAWGDEEALVARIREHWAAVNLDDFCPPARAADRHLPTSAGLHFASSRGASSRSKYVREACTQMFGRKQRLVRLCRPSLPHSRPLAPAS